VSTPERPYADDPHHPEIGRSCCEGKAPVPRYSMYRVHAINYQGPVEAGKPRTVENIERAYAISQGENPDRLWCLRCSTTLEDVRDEVSNVAPFLLSYIATLASFIPGFGTAIADVAGTLAALASGASIGDALVDGAISAIPGGGVWVGVKDAAISVLHGERVDRAFLDGARGAIVEVGGPLAGAAFDAGLAVAQGRSAQDAGFAGLHGFARGNTLADKIITFGESVTVAFETGRGLPEILLTELGSDLLEVSGASDRAQEIIDATSKRLLLSPELQQLGTDALATALGIGEPFARAAQVIMASGVPDLVVRAAILDATEQAHRTKLFSETAVALPLRLSQQASSALAAASARAALFQSRASAVLPGRLDVLSRASLAVPVSQRLSVTSTNLASSAAEKLVRLAPHPRPAASVSASPPVGAVVLRGDGGVVSNLALGGVVAAAGVALFFWARSR
jgi:hypothetical protein